MPPGGIRLYQRSVIPWGVSFRGSGGRAWLWPLQCTGNWYPTWTLCVQTVGYTCEVHSDLPCHRLWLRISLSLTEGGRVSWCSRQLNICMRSSILGQILNHVRLLRCDIVSLPPLDPRCADAVPSVRMVSGIGIFWLAHDGFAILVFVLRIW